MDVRLVPVWERDYDEFFALFAQYHRELDPFDSAAEQDPWDAERHRAAILDDMEGREIRWIEADGRRAGFAMLRTYVDWPREDRRVASIAEFYVLPDLRRRGIGSAAVRAILDGKTVSSTRIREAIQAGNLDAASQMLGRAYALAGTVIRGDQARHSPVHVHFPGDGCFAFAEVERNREDLAAGAGIKA